MKHGSYTRQALAGIATFAVCLVLCVSYASWFEGQQERSLRTRAQYVAQNEANDLLGSLQGYEQIARVWAGVVQSTGGEVTGFDEVSQRLYEKNATINAIQIAPSGVVTYSYPTNNDILGYDILADDPNADDAREAAETGQLVVSGPVDLMQGGTGLILRYPIYLDDAFWGFSTVVLNVPEAFQDTGIEQLENEGYVYRLEKADGGGTEVVMASDGDLDDLVSASVDVGMRTWTLGVRPADGWVNAGDVVIHRIIAVVVSLIAGVGGLLFMTVLVRNHELESVRSDLTSHTKALLASEKANRMQAKALDASKKANRMQEEALQVSRRANAAQVQALEYAKRENKQQAAELKASEAANRAKTEFISRISHDIRTPIGAIKNLTSFALQDIDDKERLREDLEKIDTSNEFLLSLINDVLDISRVDSGKVELVLAPYPYEEYASNIRNILDPMCAEKGVSYEMSAESAGDGGVIVADKTRINQIVLNVLSNAVKYTPEGGKVTYVSRSEKLEDDKVRYAFTVTDTGIGMTEEFQERLFDEFTQEYDNPHREKGTTGTGLGMSIVKRMVDLMGGTIEVESALGEGTSVSVQIDFPDATRDPDYRDMLKDTRSDTDDGSAVRFSGRILVVEDNQINLAIATRMFEESGLTVDVAIDGAKGVAAFATQPAGTYQAIFMDIQMPTMNGYEATRAIRALDTEDAASVPIIAMTADAFEEAERKAHEAGMDEYVTKPLNFDFITQILIDLGLRA